MDSAVGPGNWHRNSVLPFAYPSMAPGIMPGMHVPVSAGSYQVPVEAAQSPLPMLPPNSSFFRVLVRVEPGSMLRIFLTNSCLVTDSNNPEFMVDDVLESVNGKILHYLLPDTRMQLLHPSAGLRLITVLRKKALNAPLQDRTNQQSRRTTSKAGKKAVKKTQQPASKAALRQKVDKKKEATLKNLSNPPTELLDDPPPVGTVDASKKWYSTKNNETLKDIAVKVGLGDSGHKVLALLPANKIRYGTLKSSQRFKPFTLIRLPDTGCSNWKLSKLVTETEEIDAATSCCYKCHEHEGPGRDVLLCDGCDAACHLPCAGVTEIPSGDWLCEVCLDILEARRRSAPTTLRAQLPQSLPALPQHDRDWKAHFLSHIEGRKHKALTEMSQNQASLYQDLQERIRRLESQWAPLYTDVCAKHRDYDRAVKGIMRDFGLKDYDTSKFILFETGTRLVRSRECISYWYPPQYTARWNDAVRLVQACSHAIRRDLRQERELYETAKQASDQVSNLLNQAKEEEKGWTNACEEERRQIILHFAPLLQDPKYDFEKNAEYAQRSDDTEPGLLGFVTPQDETEIQMLNVLCEPTELIVIIPISAIDYSTEALVPNAEYAIFATGDLVDVDREDNLPMDFSPTSVRTAQRHLFEMLSRDKRHEAAVISRPNLPSSVFERGNDESRYDAGACFDLSELVQDCNCPLNMPMAPTPKRLAKHGLVLRDYQRASLQFLLDKENSGTGMGLAGELWHRMQFLDGTGQYYYCDLTGSFRRDIFDYASDIHQKDAARPYGSFPAGAILGEEMGLGKTIICLSLVVANPPPKHRRVLPREHTTQLDHPSYKKLPCVLGATASAAKTKFLSNGSLVIAPMTLCSQWQTEIKKFAPFMSVLTLHNSEKPTLQQIATVDIVVVSTFALQQTGMSDILSKLKRVHFHRIFLDEAHYNQSGVKTKLSLASLSGTYRYAVTGTPVGNSLDDLYGQIRFLRVPLFCRESFWKMNIGTPYCNHDYSALRVLRTLLSHIVVRHSKQQTLNNGEAMLTLPPRTVETLLIPFGSDEERKVYETLEERNRERFQELRSQSAKTVLGKYLELTSLVYTARQACSHMSMINLESMHNFNMTLGREREAQQREKKGAVRQEGTKASMTRKDVLDLAIKNARPSAQVRMREVVLQYHDGEMDLLECPICLEPTAEADVALTPCAHTCCSECILSVLDAASTNREPKGNCPGCRSMFLRSELTFLGDAAEAGRPDESKPAAQQKSPIALETNISGFRLKSEDICIDAPQSRTLRVFAEAHTKEELRHDRAMFHSLSKSFIETARMAGSQVGTKIARLLEEVKLMMGKNSSSKCVVFSQFLGSLDIAQQEMTARGIRFVRVDGHMEQHQRADALHDFSSDASIRVFLLSMRAGAAGLNLMAADHCFILDAPLNTSNEEQAIDRIHRIGQTRPVIVKRFIIQGSVEERILSSRRALLADRPSVSTNIDGGALAESFERPSKRARQQDETDLEGRRFQCLETLESLFGCNATLRVSRA